MGAITSRVSPSYEGRGGKVSARSRAQEEIGFFFRGGACRFRCIVE